MTARLPDGHPRRGEARIRERADGHGDEARRRRIREEDGRTAFGTETEAALVAVVGDADVLAVPTFGPHPLRVEPRLEAERAPRPALTREAMTDRDTDRLA